MKVAVSTKVSASLLNDVDTIEWIIKRHLNKEAAKYKFGWIGNLEMQIGCNADDFIKNRKTVLQTFDYIPTPRIIRKPEKKKRNVLNRYL